MNCSQLNPRRMAKAHVRVGLALVLMTVGISTGVLGCSSSAKVTTPVSTPDAGSPTDSGVSQDGGEFGACTSSAPVAPAPDLNGSWAIRTVASRYVPATGLTSAFYTRTDSVLLTSVTQTGTDVTISAAYCDQSADTDSTALAYVIIPDSYVKSLKPFVVRGTYAMGSAGADVILLPTFIEVQGATLADPTNDPLPTDPSDPAVTDQDQDGNPGITIKLGGIVSGDLYVVQRQKSELTGIAVSSDRVEGHYGFTSEQNILTSNPTALKTLAAQTAIADPTLCASTFTMVRVQATWTCIDVNAATTLFN